MKDYNARNIVRKFMKENHATMVKVVKKMNENHPEQTVSAQNLSNKLLRNTIKFSEIMEIADVLDYEIQFVKKGNTEKVENARDEYNRCVMHEIEILALQIINKSISDNSMRDIQLSAMQIMNKATNREMELR